MSAVTRLLLVADRRSPLIGDFERLFSFGQSVVTSRVLPATPFDDLLATLDDLIAATDPSVVAVVVDDPSLSVQLTEYIDSTHGLPALSLDARRAERGDLPSEERRPRSDRERRIEIERQQQLFAGMVTEVTEVLSDTLDPTKVLDAVLGGVVRILDCDSAAILMLSDGNLEIAVHRGLSTQAVDQAPLEQSTLGHFDEVIRERHVVLITDAQVDERWHAERQLHPPPIRSWLGVPLIVRDHVIGVLSLADSRPNVYAVCHGQLALAFASHAAIAYDNAQLYARTCADAETRESLLREVNHRVKNNLAAIIGLLYTEEQAYESKDAPECSLLIERMVNRIQGLASVHGMLSASGWTPLPLDELVHQVARNALQMLPPDKYLQVNVNPSPVKVTPKQANDLAIVINELTMNTIKHALHGRKEGRVDVHIEREGSWITLRFRNDGPGYPPKALEMKGETIGLYLVNTIVQYNLRGELNLLSNNGAVAVVRFKVADEFDET